MNYDHHYKAGNPLDCIKHPSLIAALSLKKEEMADAVFTYLDAFAGYSWNPLLTIKPKGEQKVYHFIYENKIVEFEWTKGIQIIFENRRTFQETKNDSILKWLSGYVCNRPKLHGGWYPGSAVIAADILRPKDRLLLFDISESARQDLKKHLAGHGDNFPQIVVGVKVDIPSKETTDSFITQIQEPDFVFLDPPGLYKAESPDYPKWHYLLKSIMEPRNNAKKATLLWLPWSGQDKPEDEKMDYGSWPWSGKEKGSLFDRWEEARKAGFSITAFRYKANSYSGCALMYNCAKDDIKSVVSEMVRLANLAGKSDRSSDLSDWECHHSD